MSDESPDLPEPGPAPAPAEGPGSDDLPRTDPALHESQGDASQAEPQLARAEESQENAAPSEPAQPEPAAESQGDAPQTESSAASHGDASQPPAEAEAEAEGAESGESDEQPDEPDEPAEGEGAEGLPAPESLAPGKGDGRPAFVAPVSLALSSVLEDESFQLRDPGDVAGLATSIARLGQLFPVDVRPQGERVQVLAGFRRLKALRMLQRDRVMARVHEGMTDTEALSFALAQALESRPLERQEVEALRDRLTEEGRLDPVSRGLIEAALTTPGSDLEPEAGQPGEAGAEEGEVDLDELAADLEQRLSGISADLAAVTDLWGDMEEGARAALLDQLRYYSELYAYYSRLK
jgi:hypothetical protein